MEYQGDGIVALTSKTYICFSNNVEKTTDDEPDEVNIKTASKGLNKSLNKLTKEHYLNVLRTMKNGGGINKGIKTDSRKMFTYQQTRDCLSYLYIKRKVESDGIRTTPLDV